MSDTQTLPDPPGTFIEDKRPVGRPTTYKPEYCDSIIIWGKLGKSKEWIAAELSVTPKTLDNWAVANEEFLQALEVANLKSQQWWEDTGQNGMQSKAIDGSIWSRSMAARFPRTWREKVSNEHTGLDGGPIKTHNTNIDITNMNPDALDALEKALLLIETPVETPDDGEEE